MTLSIIIHFLSELTYLLVVFGVFLVVVIFRGRQTVTNLIVGLYLGLLFFLEFPYQEALFGTVTGVSLVAAKLALFVTLAIAATVLCYRIMPNEYREGKIDSLGKKLLLACAGTMLIMAFSFQVHPVTELVTPGTPIQSLFASPQSFFWWLLTPLIILFFAS